MIMIKTLLPNLKCLMQIALQLLGFPWRASPQKSLHLRMGMSQGLQIVQATPLRSQSPMPTLIGTSISTVVLHQPLSQAMSLFSEGLPLC